MNYVNRRTNYLNEVKENSISIFFSGIAPQKSADQNYPFVVNRNFFYLSNIDQDNACLILVKGTNKTESFLFIEKTDPIKALWDGSGYTFEEAKDLSKIDNVLDIKSLEQFIQGLFQASRRALFGELEYVYFDLEKYGKETFSTLYQKEFSKKYPFLQVKSNHLILANLRTAKDEVEIDSIKKAIDITNDALNVLMKNLKPNMNEREIEALYTYELNKAHSSPSFDTIAASGVNATILHYVDNNDNINDNELILLDLGALYNNYASDITRTYPANGKYTERQKAVYEIVLEANKKTIEWLKPGITMEEFNNFGKKILIEGAKKLGLIKEDEEITKYYYHSLGHYLGLDVHDIGDYTKPIPEGAIITVEPGLYIKEENIGIRIEDDILITKDGNINLSKHIIKEVKDIEVFMKK